MTVHPLPSTEHVDVLIVGAGLSGIGVARQLETDRPGTSYLILETRATTGGTWDLFRYPGIRSDSDMHTYGYGFKPWAHKKAIAGADSILAYLRETATEYGIDRHIRVNHKVIQASWSSAQALWSVEVERLDTGERKTILARWFFSAAGFYRHDEGYTPKLDGIENFGGTVVHPQHWPEDLDYGGKRVVVIGSGATAVTLLPAMADKAGHVTMLQRTPTYVVSLPSEDLIANTLRRIMPHKWAYAIVRRKNVAISRFIWRFCRSRPQAARRLIRYLNKRQLPKDYPVDVHFNPPYNPWDQRLCVVPDGDLFKSIRDGRASVVTDRIRTFTETGIVLESGQTLPADIIVTATGLNVRFFGGIKLVVDGEPVDLHSRVAFKGMMLSGVPNFGFSIGYTNSSWTMKVGLLAEHFCRLLTHMERGGYAVCMPELPAADMPTRPLLDFGAGYIKRAIDGLPRQGPGTPWIMSMDYHVDVRILRHGPVEDPNLRFGHAPAAGGTDRVEARRAVGA
ncbi:NAD(P)/FAD-dependent oxidoreductase (plasmid) [Burkholderia cepacia]|uniref:flavin-containing monooxygenase n=1 Tax=Burkholderia cepacia TaxID=292 RepID=UPI000758C810|nr:NAD(P)/FAD-dependent oxidoreductase [Burkholderia cepacia]KVW05497.1 FAD-containing monooxygenase EthA [Burkholderia cepacia]